MSDGVGANILIVDDRVENLVALEEILSGAGRTLFRATSGQKALKLVLEHEFAVILMDVRMPEMDGLETAEYIRKNKRTQSTPIIFVTASDDNLDRITRGYSIGAVDYIIKPIPTEILQSKVKVLVDLHLKTKEVALKADALARANEELRKTVEHRKRAEEEIRIAYKQLEEFSYTVAHDLRAPLRAMTGFSQLLREDYREKPLDQTGQDYALRIEQGAKQMDALIRDLLAYCTVARAKLDLGTVDPGPVLRELLEQEAMSEAVGEVDLELTEGFPLVVGHRSFLSQVFSNLISNALKFTRSGVRSKISISHETREGWVRLTIQDNGIGIDPRYRDRIFKTFERLDPSAYPGTGMGLAIARAAMERMGGRIGFESDPGLGSRFWIELPRHPQGNSAKENRAGSSICGIDKSG